jgi:hypothetical protein
MEKYLRRVAENRHFKGFVAGVVTSTITFGLLSSMLIYRLSMISYVDDYEFDYRGYDNNNDNFSSGRKIMERQTSDAHLVETQMKTPIENVVLKVSERDISDKEGVVVNAESTWPTFHDARDTSYYP